MKRPESSKPDTCQAELLVLWGDHALMIRHLRPGSTFVIGTHHDCDLVLPCPLPESDPFPAVAVDGHGNVVMKVPRGAAATLALADGPATLIAAAEVREVALPAGAVGWLSFGRVGLRIESQPVEARPARFGLTPNVLWLALAMFVSFGAHAWWFAWTLVFMPPLGLAEDEAVQRDMLVLMQHYLQATAQPEREAGDTRLISQQRLEEGGTGFRAAKEEGVAGNSASRSSMKHYAVRGYSDEVDSHIARTESRHEAAEFGLIGLLNQATGGDMGAPVAPWGQQESAGNEIFSARGSLWGDLVGESFGAGGLGLSGIGEGGGGRGEGVGLGVIGTIGQGSGTGTSQGFGRGSHRTGPAVCRCAAASVDGRLPPEVIKRVVLANHARFRYCYEQGLRVNPRLGGRITTYFVIGRDGSVSSVSNGGSDLPDQQVVQCVQRTFRELSFPEPVGGIVTVIYPLVFTPVQA